MATVNYRDPGTGQFVPLEMGGMPVGSVISFAGTAAPAGWHLCDGTAHGSAALQAILGSATTPNLQDRFVVGVGTTHAAAATGGAETVTLTTAQAGNSAHTHAVTSGNNSVSHTHTFTTNSLGGHKHSSAALAKSIRNTDMANGTTHDVLAHSSTSSTLWGAVAHTHPTVNTSNTSGNHTHQLTIASSAAVAGTEAHENLPPFYALAFIICTG